MFNDRIDSKAKKKRICATDLQKWINIRNDVVYNVEFHKRIIANNHHTILYIIIAH